MARETRRPALLAELFSALGDDPFLIAECLVRPALVERLLSEDRHAHDRDVLSRWEAEGTSLSADIETLSSSYTLATPHSMSMCQDDTWTPTSVAGVSDGRSDHAAVWTGSEMLTWGVAMTMFF